MLAGHLRTRRIIVVEQNHSAQFYHYLVGQKAIPSDAESVARPGPPPFRPSGIASFGCDPMTDIAIESKAHETRRCIFPRAQATWKRQVRPSAKAIAQARAAAISFVLADDRYSRGITFGGERIEAPAATKSQMTLAEIGRALVPG
jgi:hypothetical protein